MLSGIRSVSGVRMVRLISSRNQPPDLSLSLLYPSRALSVSTSPQSLSHVHRSMATGMFSPTAPTVVRSGFSSPPPHYNQRFFLGRWNFGVKKAGTSLTELKRRVLRVLKFTLVLMISSVWVLKHYLAANRRTLICAANQDAESAFKKTVEVDKLIDMLRVANASELQKLVVENVLAFNEGFWIRLAARAETCKSEDDKKDYEELALSVMSIVDRLVHKTKEKIESSTDILKEILAPIVNEAVEVSWPPRDPKALILMEKKLIQREQEGKLDEGFLAEVNAQLRQATGDVDKPGLQAMLQKVLQLYASRVLSKRSYAKKGSEILKAEEFLETVIKAPEEEWNKILLNGLTLGKGDISPEEFNSVLKKRIERTLIRTEGGSYQQRVLTEYLKGIQSRTKEIVKVLQGKQQ